MGIIRDMCFFFKKSAGMRSLLFIRVVKSQENQEVFFPVVAIREPVGGYIHFPRMLPAVPHRFPDFGIIDGPDDLCL